MNKIKLSLILILCTSFHLKAQFSVGLEAGYNKNYLITSTAYRAFMQYKPLEGFNIGIPVKYKINDWFAIQADPQFIRKSFKWERTGYFQGVYQKNINNYVQLPIMANFSFGGEKLKGFLNLGAYTAYWATGKVIGKQNDMFGATIESDIETGPVNIFDYEVGAIFDEKYDFNKKRDRRIDLGLVAGLGLNYNFKSRYEFFAEGRYYRALLDMQKNYMIDQMPRYNDTFALQIGCFYRLGKSVNK